MNDVAATLSNGLWQAGDIVKNVELGFHQYSVSSGWVGSMEGFNNRSLFMISSSSDQSLSIGGIPVDPAATPIEIKGNRWHYISYLPKSTEERRVGKGGVRKCKSRWTPNNKKK